MDESRESIFPFANDFKYKSLQSHANVLYEAANNQNKWIELYKDVVHLIGIIGMQWGSLETLDAFKLEIGCIN